MRRPPILGATGINFGHKPAISLVLPNKKPRRMNDDEIEPSEGDYDFDLEVEPDTEYDIVLGILQGVTIVSARINNMSDAGTLSFLINGTPITFSSGDGPGSFPTDILEVPASGTWDFICSQAAPVGADITVHMLAFDDPSVAFGGLLGRLHYTIP